MKKSFDSIFGVADASVGGRGSVKNFKIIDPTVYRRVREQAAVSEADVKLYRDIFAALKANDIKTAEELQKQLKGHALLGHVLAEKYLHKDYKSSYEELQNWLKSIRCFRNIRGLKIWQ